LEYQTIIYEEKDKIATVIFNRPKVLNAMNIEMIREMTDAIERVKKNTDIRVLVFRGAGDKAFSAGADIAEMQDKSSFELKGMVREWVNFFHEIEVLPKPVIAAVQGYAPGGGTELSLCCDMVIAADDAKFGLAEIRIGVIPGCGATIRLPRWVGKAKAMEILMTGDLVGAEEAVKIGLANKVVPKEKLLEVTSELVNKLAQRGPLALAAAKACVNTGAEMDRDRGIEYAIHEFVLLFDSEDQKEGMKAFLEKRIPQFKGK
jgi:enoyl-CoA hydratase/carnithine racemase